MLQRVQSKKNSKIMDQRKIFNPQKIKRLETNKLKNRINKSKIQAISKI